MHQGTSETKTYRSNGLDERQRNAHWHVSMRVISPFDKKYGFVVRCNICSILCEAQIPRFFSYHETLVLKKASFKIEFIKAS